MKEFSLARLLILVLEIALAARMLELRTWSLYLAYPNSLVL
jgi:hypothetical protein